MVLLLSFYTKFRIGLLTGEKDVLASFSLRNILTLWLLLRDILLDITFGFKQMILPCYIEFIMGWAYTFEDLRGLYLVD